MTRRAAVAFAAGIALTSAAGCAVSRSASPGVPAEDAASAPPRASVADQQVALDFVNAIVQLIEDDTVPLSFPVEERGEQPVLDTMRTMLAESGYVIGGADGRAMRHRVAEIDSAGERLRRHDVAVGSVELRRSYRRTGAGTVLPASALYVRGADAASVRMMDEKLFGAVTGDGRALPPVLADELLASYRHLFADTAVVGAGAIATLAPAANVRELGRSNYASWLDALDTVVEHGLTFAPGSDRLDATDVALIDDVLGRFEAATDVVSIVGYSSGGSAGPETNREMAMRRADRVREALTAVGVPADRVFVEGYWSESVEDGVPSRGAVLSLRRGAT